MRLKSLELVGFKSFVDRTVIHFEDGVTGIVGPNGAGKSNCVDAIRWVMGEQSAKHLRGGDMQDVIFAGSQKRPAMGMASVFLTFDNSDGRAPAEFSQYAEITVGRRLYRSGESEYYINKTPCRLKDIVDLFLGTGTGTKAYSIVEQGRIGQIVTAKPEELRLLIEEAAGISKFRNRRDAAQRKMESTRQNLARLQDIVKELERQLSSLQRQAKKAERYKILSSELRELELTSASHHWHQWRTELAQLESRLHALGDVEGSASATVGQHESAIEEGRLRLAEIECEVSQAQEKTYTIQNQIHLHEAKIDHAEKQQAETGARIAQATSDINELQTRRQIWNEDLERTNGAKVVVDLALGTACEDVERFEQDVQALRQRRDESHREVATVEETLREASGRKVAAEGRLLQCDHRVETLQQRREEMSQTATELTEQLVLKQQAVAVRRGSLQQYDQQSLRMGEEEESARQTLSQQDDEAHRLSATVTNQQSRLQHVLSRVSSLEELIANHEGYHEGVKTILRAREASEEAVANVVGVVAETFATAPAHAAALAVVLGDRLQGVIVPSQQEGFKVLEYLKTRQGRGTFIPAALRHTSKAWAHRSGEGIIGPLLDQVSCDASLRNVADYLFGDVLLVDSLATALRYWQAGDADISYVTLDGELLNAAGIVSGGGCEEGSSSMLTRRDECALLRLEASQLQTEIGANEERRRRHQMHIDALTTQLETLTKDRHTRELSLVQQREEMNYRAQEVARIESEVANVQAQCATIAVELQQIESDRQMATIDAGTAVEQECAATNALSGQRAAEGALRAQYEAVTEALGQRRTTLATQEERVRATEREIEQLVRSLAEAACTIDRKGQEVKDGESTIATAIVEIAQLRGAVSTLVEEATVHSESQREVQGRHQALLEEVRAKEGAIRELRRQHETAVKEKHAADVNMTQQQERLGFLRREMFDKYHVAIDDVASEYIREAYDEETTTAQVDELRAKVERLGGVNTDAIEEFEELQERHEFLSRQSNDLEESIASLHRAITKINRVSRERFRETFGAINERFQQLFPKVFRGGKAELRLTNEEELLEAGVEIAAQPPGKKLQNMTLLSGGEKALTAVAIIFAMFLVRPSPFCLLDEVDAPLDDANIDRFNEIVREMTQYAQFILITHNKRTMELADVLYGVTMEEAGASKLVSVRLNGGEAEDTSTASSTAAA